MKTGTIIIEGHPCSMVVEQDPETKKIIEKRDDELFTDLSEVEQNLVMSWISMKIKERKSANYGYSSYSLKHILEQEIGIYMTNNQFKDAMLHMGHIPVKEEDLNWYFRIENVVNNHVPRKQAEFFKKVIEKCSEV